MKPTPNILKGLILSTLLHTALFAQFDSLIFYRDGIYLDYSHRDIYSLGDQNDDGYDDIMIYDCNLEESLVFLGGNPMDIIPDFVLPMNDKGTITAIDLNNDTKKDVVFHTRSSSGKKIKIFFGGNLLDSIPDLIFSPPTEHGYGLFNINDFNGDGRDELVYYDYFQASNFKQYGRYYFYNTGSEFDTIPYYFISGDSVNNVKLSSNFSFGDLNGDGKSDLTIYGYVGNNPPYEVYFRNFYLGNSSWDLEEDQVFYQNEHSFDIAQMKIVKDINGNNRDDILIEAYGNVYPNYYHNSILYGSFPVDTLQDVGLNTQNEALNLASDGRVGDVNGDGFNDLFVQTIFGYPDVKLWVGSPSMDELPKKEWEGTSSGFGRVIAGVGDVNGDSVNDIAICEIFYGGPNPNCSSSKVYIFMGDTGVVTEVRDEKLPIPVNFELYDPYPNPFNPSTNISWYQAHSGNVTIKVFNTIGEDIVKLLDEEKTGGKYEIEFDASKHNLNSGIYLINLIVMKGGKEIFTQSKKVTLLK